MHSLYALKTKVSVLTFGYAVGHSSSHSGSVSDITIFQESMKWHKHAFLKLSNNITEGNSNDEVVEKHPNN